MSQPLPIGRLHHLARNVRDLEKSRAFYRDVLGFAEVPRPNFDFPGAWLFNYGLQIHLIVAPSGQPSDEPINSRTNHVAFQAADLDAVERLLVEHGVRYRVNYQANNPNVKQIFFHDPDGHHIEVGAYPDDQQ